MYLEHQQTLQFSLQQALTSRQLGRLQYKDAGLHKKDET